MNARKKGVTLLETVVAMLLLTIITGAAFTICSSAATSVGVTVKDFNSLVDCENIVECFKATNTKTDFETLLRACGYDGFVYGAAEDGTSSDKSVLVFVFGEHGCKVTATLTKEGTAVDDGALNDVTLSLTAVSMLDADKTMYATSYTKGGGNE